MGYVSYVLFTIHAFDRHTDIQTDKHSLVLHMQRVKRIISFFVIYDVSDLQAWACRT